MEEGGTGAEPLNLFGERERRGRANEQHSQGKAINLCSATAKATHTTPVALQKRGFQLMECCDGKSFLLIPT